MQVIQIDSFTIFCTWSEKCVQIRARGIVGFAGSGPIFETENRFVSRQEAKNRSIKPCISQDFAIHRLTLSPVRIVHT